MSNFSVDITTIENLLPIEGADFIELAQIRGYQAIVKKNQYQIGDKIAYIPEDAILPDSLIELIGLTGKLSGSKKNRVKAIKLRGCLSQGIVFPSKDEWNLGDNVMEELGITKHEVEVPAHLRGKVANANIPITMTYDVENFKNYPNLIHEGEEVVITEKLHGTCSIFTALPDSLKFERTFKEMITSSSYDRETKVLTPATYGEEQTVVVDFFAASKGLSKQGLIFVIEENKDNVYVDVANSYKIKERMFASPSIKYFHEHNLPVHILGEILGPGIQDLKYSSNMNDKPMFRLFDIYVGKRGEGYFLGDDALSVVVEELGLTRVPVLYKGPFSKAKLLELTNGKETVSGKGLHIREGVVVRTANERTADDQKQFSKTFDRGKVFDGLFSRVQLKSVSGDYLTRKSPEATEYQ